MKSTGLPTGKGAAFNDILKQTFNDVDLQPEEIPRLDLYGSNSYIV